MRIKLRTVCHQQVNNIICFEKEVHGIQLILKKVVGKISKW